MHESLVKHSVDPVTVHPKDPFPPTRISPANVPFPPNPSSVILVGEALLPSVVRKIDLIYIKALVDVGVISNALAIKRIQDIHKKNNVAHFIKLILFLGDWRFL